MSLKIVRSLEDIDRVRDAARSATFVADEAGTIDHTAEAMYGLLNWMFGDDDEDPVAHYLPDDEDDDEDDLP